jgi:hypothetical protein
LVGTGPRSGEGMATLTPEAQEIFGATYDEPDHLWLRVHFTRSDKSQAAGREFLKRFRLRAENRDREVNENTPTDGFADNSRLYLPPTAFNRFAVTREINDGLLAPRFAPSQRAWVLSGVRVPVRPEVDASTGRDADDR